MKRYSSLIVSICVMMVTWTTVWAQEILVTCFPVSNPLPPNAGLYVSDPGRFFNITVRNLTTEPKQLFLGFELQQVTGGDFAMSTPVRYQPEVPLTLAGSQTLTLLPDQLRNLFKQIPLEQVATSGGSLVDYKNSAVGLLPEGFFTGHVTAYAWDLYAAHPQAISDPEGGLCNFQICYNAPAPVIVSPVENDFLMVDAEDMTADTYEVLAPKLNFAQSAVTFAWTPSTCPCAGVSAQPTYTLEFYSLKGNQTPEEAVAQSIEPHFRLGPIRATSQTLNIPATDLKLIFLEGQYYVVRVVAAAGQTDDQQRGFSLIANNGASPLRVFCATHKKETGTGNASGDAGGTGGSDTPGDAGGSDGKDGAGDGDSDADTPEPNDTIYVNLKYPQLTEPRVSEKDDVYSVFTHTAGQPIKVKWQKPSIIEGETDATKKAIADTLTGITYTVGIYSNKLSYLTYADMLQTKPLIKKEDIKELEHEFSWKELEEAKIAYNQRYTILITAKYPYDKKLAELKPHPAKVSFVGGGNDYTFILPPDFSQIADCEVLHKVENEVGQAFGANDLKDKDVQIGDFVLRITSELTENKDFKGVRAAKKSDSDDKSGDKKDEPKSTKIGPAYSGTGYVTWSPYGVPIQIAVKFDSLVINKDYEVVDGVAYGYKNGDDGIPDGLLSNLTSLTSSEYYDTAKEKLKEATNDYWCYLRQAGILTNDIAQVSGGSRYGADPIGMPMSLAKLGQWVLPDDMMADIAIHAIRFSPTTASLDAYAVTTLPDLETHRGQTQVLGFVAPRMCIQPNRFEINGKFSLLYDLTFRDPRTRLEFQFNAPTSYKAGEDNDGCFLEFKEGKFVRMHVDLEANLNSLIPDDGTGKPIPGQTGCRARSQFDLTKNWEWIAEMSLFGASDGKAVTGFQVKGAEGYTFITDRLVLDHSSIRNGDGMVFPETKDPKDNASLGYDWKKYATEAGVDYKEDDKEHKNWQGLYAPNIRVIFPEVLTDMKEGEEAGKADHRFGIGVKNLLIDNSGYSVTASVSNVVRVGNISSFSLTIDEIYCKFIQSNFNSAGFNGKVTVPLICAKDSKGKAVDSGAMAYEAKITYGKNQNLANADSDDGKKDEAAAAEPDRDWAEDLNFIFSCKPQDHLTFDFFLADVSVDKFGTYLNITKKGFSTAKAEFVTSGTISISSSLASKEKQAALPFKLPGIHFAGLRVANFRYDNKVKDRFAETYTQAIAKAKEDYKKQLEDAKKKGQDTKNITDFYDWMSNDKLEEYKDVIDKSIANNEVNNTGPGAIYFSLGDWSLASEEKKMWNLSFTLNKIALQVKDFQHVGLYLNGSMKLLGSDPEKFGIGAGLGLTIWTKIDWDAPDISYDKVTFSDVDVNGHFSGAIEVGGKLAVSNDLKKGRGMSGGLNFNVKGLFNASLSGGYYGVGDEEDGSDDKSDESQQSGSGGKSSPSFKAGYFFGEVSGMNVPIGPVSLTGIMGGFYFNYGVDTGKARGREAYIKALQNPTLRQGAIGGAFGLKMAVGTDAFVKGDLGMNILINTKSKKVEEIHLQGNVHALCASADSEKGLVNASADIVYVDDIGNNSVPLKEQGRKFTLCVTADVGQEVQEIAKEFTGSPLEIPECIGDLNEFDASKAEDKGDGSNKSNGTDANGYVKQGIGATIGLEFKFQYLPNADKKKNLWHLYVGEPAEDKRCRITFIDFAVGKNKPVGLWAKVFANFYLCVGNELPGDGALPDVPKAVQDVLGINTDGSSNANKSKLDQARAEVMKGGPAGNINGGIMIGAALGAEIGCNAIFCYCDVAGMLGFDAVLKQYATSARCSDGSRVGGKNGFYATGQIYAMLRGELGLMLDLWIYKGKIPLVDMAFGAMLKGGVPNPTWAYGKVKARGKILGGLIKFNSSVEMKVGRVCVPEYGNPLDDIKIFGDVAPGADNKEEGWGKDSQATPYDNISFVTNMRMDSKMTLVDENIRAKHAGMNGNVDDFTAIASRTYIFHLDPEMTVEKFNNGSSDKASNLEMAYAVDYKTTDHENYMLNSGSLKANSFYRYKLGGYAKEIINGVECDPLFNDSTTNYKDVHKPWRQEITHYFCTGPYSDNMDLEVVDHLPAVGKSSLEEAGNPMLMLMHDRADYWDNPDNEFDAEFTYIPPYKTAILPDIAYDEKTGMRLEGQTSKYENLKVRHVVEKGVDEDGKEYEYATVVLDQPLPYSYFKPNTNYKYTIYRTDVAQLNNHIKQITERWEQIMSTVEQEAADASALETLANDASDPLKQEMAQYYLAVKDELGSDEAQQRLREYADHLKSNTSSFRSVCYRFDFKTGESNTIAERGIENKLLSKVNNYGQYKYSPLTQWRFDKINFSGARNLTNNPYVQLNYWNHTGGIHASRLPKFILNGRSFDAETQTLTWQKVYYDEYRTNGGASKSSTTNKEFIDDFSPEGYQKWTSGPSTYIGMPEVWKKMFSDDCDVAETFNQCVNEEWLYMTRVNGKNLSVDQMKEMVTFPNPLFKDFKSRMETAIAAKEDLDMYISSDVLNYYYTHYNSVVVMPKYQIGYMYAATDGRMGLSLAQLKTDVTDQAYYMEDPSKGFSTQAFKDNIKSIEYDVRLCTGWNIAPGGNCYGIRPMTRGQYQVHCVVDGDFESLGNPSKTTTTNSDYVYIPDDNLREFVLKHYDSNKDGKLQQSEADKITEIVFSDLSPAKEDKWKQVTTTQGIENMPNLETLDLWCVTRVNVSNNPKLTSLRIAEGDGIESIDLSHNPELVHLSIMGDYTSEVRVKEKYGLKSIILTNCPNLTSITLNFHRLSGTLDLRHCTKLSGVDLRGNCLDKIMLPAMQGSNEPRLGRQFKKGSDSEYHANRVVKLYYDGALSNKTKLYNYLVSTGAKAGKENADIVFEIEAKKDNINEMYNTYVKIVQEARKFIYDYIKDENLRRNLLETYGTRTVRYVYEKYSENDVRFNWSLDYDTMSEETFLYVDGLGIETLEGLEHLMPSLTCIYAEHNRLEKVDLAVFPHLDSFYGADNRIVSVTIPDNCKITTLRLSENEIVSFDATKLPLIKYLNLANNNLQILDVSNAENLQTLYADHNQLQHLVLTNCSKLEKLHAQNNDFKVAELANGGLSILANGLLLPTAKTKLTEIYVNTKRIGQLDFREYTSLKTLRVDSCRYLYGIYVPKSVKDLSIRYNPLLAELNGHRFNNLPTHILSQQYTHFRAAGSFQNAADSERKLNFLATLGSMEELDLTDCLQDEVIFTAIWDCKVYLGVPNRRTGKKVHVSFNGNEYSLASWDNYLKDDPRNIYVEATLRDSQTANLTLEQISDKDIEMQKALGPKLYEYIWKKYAPTQRAFHTANASNLTELDISYQKVTSLDAINKYFIYLKKLNCAGNEIVNADIHSIFQLETLDISNNPGLETLSTVAKKVNVSNTSLKSNYFEMYLKSATEIEARDYAGGFSFITLTKDQSKLKSLVITGSKHQNIRFDYSQLDTAVITGNGPSTTGQWIYISNPNYSYPKQKYVFGSADKPTHLNFNGSGVEQGLILWYNLWAKNDPYCDNVEVSYSSSGLHKLPKIRSRREDGSFIDDRLTLDDIKFFALPADQYELYRSVINPDGRFLHESDLRNLTTLDLSGRGLTEIPELLISTMWGLETLDLSNNKFQTLDLSKQGHKSLCSIKNLNVSHNPLTTLTLPNEVRMLSIDVTSTKLSYDAVNDLITRCISVAFAGTEKTRTKDFKVKYTDKLRDLRIVSQSYPTNVIIDRKLYIYLESDPKVSQAGDINLYFYLTDPENLYYLPEVKKISPYIGNIDIYCKNETFAYRLWGVFRRAADASKFRVFFVGSDGFKLIDTSRAAAIEQEYQFKLQQNINGY